MSKPLNRWYTAAPWRPEGGQRHHATSSAVSTFQLASRSTNSSGSYQFSLTNPCVRPIILVHTVPLIQTFFFTKRTSSNHQIIHAFILESLFFSQHERASYFRDTECLVFFPRVSHFSDTITRKSHRLYSKD